MEYIMKMLFAYAENGHICQKGRLGYRCSNQPNEHL
jgi:hypothetical protein